MKVTKKDNYRVIIEPRGLGNYGFASISDHAIEPDETKRNQRYKELCEEIVDDVKRHVDSVGSVYVDFDTTEICEYWGYEWETDENGCPVCCQKAVDEWDSKNKRGIK